MFNKKYWKMIKWIYVMAKKHQTYSFKLLVSGTEIIIYVDGTDDVYRSSTIK
jgi:hypothetical protein